jgi:GT2 family glycosyltransferase
VSDYVKTDQFMKKTEHNPTCSSMYRKQALKEVGGFDENLWPGEDVELDLKIRKRGYALMYNPAAQVAHYRPATYTAFARMFTRYGRAQGYLVRRYGLFRRVHWVPILLALGCLVLAALAAWQPITLLAASLPLFLFLSWFVVRTGSFITGIEFTVLMVITIACWNWGFVAGYLTGSVHPVRC